MIVKIYITFFIYNVARLLENSVMQGNNNTYQNEEIIEQQIDENGDENGDEDEVLRTEKQPVGTKQQLKIPTMCPVCNKETGGAHTCKVCQKKYTCRLWSS